MQDLVKATSQPDQSVEKPFEDPNKVPDQGVEPLDEATNYISETKIGQVVKITQTDATCFQQTNSEDTEVLASNLPPEV